MYNRYVPQEDGSFRKTKLNEPEQHGCSQEIPREVPLIRLDHPGESRVNGSPQGIGSFFKSLFPEGLDTEDLIVILLLLLLSQDREHDKNRSLLTLGAYLFL